MHRFMFAKQWTDAIVCACRVFDNYADVIGKDKAAVLRAAKQSTSGCARAQ